MEVQSTFQLRKYPTTASQNQQLCGVYDRALNMVNGQFSHVVHSKMKPGTSKTIGTDTKLVTNSAEPFSHMRHTFDS